MSAEQVQSIGENIQATLSENKLTLTIDISKRLGRSASGKTIIVATTHGNQQFAGVVIGLNIYTKEV